MSTRYKVILDCDNSFGLFGRDIDDGLALLYLLGRPEIDLLGVTLCFGNTRLATVITTTRRLLTKVGRDGLPLKIGAGYASHNIQRSEAAEFLAASAAKYKGEVIVVATGPLSNLATAQQLDENFFDNLAAIHIMGGTTQALRPGLLDCRELNFSADPAAAAVVLNAAAHCRIRLFPAQVCLQAFFGWSDLHRLRGLPYFIQLNILRWLCCFNSRYLSRYCYFWDLLPAVAVTHPTLFSSCSVAIDNSGSQLEQGRLALTGAGAIQRIDVLQDRELLLDIACQTWQMTLPRCRGRLAPATIRSSSPIWPPSE